jgi:glycosyltransferase involved in cell wall biosynthesis
MITVVLPVYNGGDFLRRCIESLARQDSGPGSFELVVLDSGSTDGGLEALQVLPGGIPHRVVASDRSLSIEQNWARIRELQDVREFMTTIGHDDMLDPDFIRIMSQSLREQPDVRLLFSHFRLIDGDDRPIRPCLPMGDWETAGQFLAGRLARTRDSFGTGYVFRSDDYRAVGGIPSYPKLMFADDALWIRLAQRHRIRILHNQCFSYRVHATNTSGVKDAGVLLRAFVQYVDFLEQIATSDDDVMRAMATYGPAFVRTSATHWIWEEAIRANDANDLASDEIVTGWRKLRRRFLSFVKNADPILEETEEVAFSLWVNQDPLLRRLWKSRVSRGLLRTLKKKMSKRPSAT